MCIMIILISVFLTSNETVRTIKQIDKICVYSVICMLITNVFMYIFTFIFFSFPSKSQRKLHNLVIQNHQLVIIKEWDKTESRMRVFEIIGMILSALIWIFAFYISFGFTLVWTIQKEAFLINFAMCFVFDFIGGEIMIELLIAVLYLDRKHNSFFRFIADRLNRLRNVRCLSP